MAPVVDETGQQPPLTATAKQIQLMLNVIENDILPKTRLVSYE